MTTIPATVQQPVSMPVQGSRGESNASGGITPADIIAILKQRMVAIILLWLLFAAIGIGVFLLLWYKYPGWTAEAFVECVSENPKANLTLQEGPSPQDAFERFIQSQALFMKSPSVLSAVLTDPEVRGTKWFQNIEAQKHMDEIDDELRAAPIPETNLIRVAITTREKTDPNVIVNKAVDIYIAEARNRYVLPYRNELENYQRELSDVRTSIRQKQEQIQQFLATLPPGEAQLHDSNQAGPLTSKLIEQQRTVSELELQTEELKSLRDLYADPTGQAVTEQDKLIVEQDPRVAQLDNQVFSLEQELLVLKDRFGANHRESKEMAARLERAQEQLDIARKTRLREYLAEKLDQVETAFFNSQHALLKAQEQLEEVQAERADLDRKLAEYDLLLQERDMLTEQKNKLDEYIHELQRVVREQQAIRIESLGRAPEPTRRSFPPLILLPAIVVLTLGFSAALAVGLELIDTSVKSPQDVVRHVSVALLGTIPDTDDEEVDIEHVERAVLDAPQSLITEAFRTVRSNLQFSAPAERMRSILVTSPKPEDGKTAVVANLAASLAISGRRVLVVDANLRRPAVHRVFGGKNEKGVTNILIGEIGLDACIQHTSQANLDFVSTGPLPPNPAELLNGQHFRDLLAEASKTYDHILLDSSPVLLASDALVMASVVDGTVLVLRAKANSRGIAQRACGLLHRMNAHIFGAVLNGAQVRRGGYFREQLRTYYEYHDEEGEYGRLAALPDAKPDKPKDQDENEKA